MKRLLIAVGILMIFLAGCGDAPREMEKEKEPYIVSPVENQGLIEQVEETTASETEMRLIISSVTSPVRQGDYASVKADTRPGADCTIAVHYKSGPSKARGLSPKKADENGYVAWSWKVGSRTTPGEWKIVITSRMNGESALKTTYFTVTR